MKKFTYVLLTMVCALFTAMSADAQTKSWKYVTAGDATTYAIKNDGTLWSWGWNESGQMGINDVANQKISTPTQVGEDNDWKSVFAGQAYAFFIKEDGTLWAVGDNSYGCSGVGDGAAKHSVPTQVGTDTGWEQVACSHFFGHSVLAIKTDGTLWAWGDNNSGTLGTGNTQSKTTPTQVGTDTDWKHVVVGDNATIAIKQNGTLWGWGFGSIGQLFDNGFVKSPVQLGTDTDWTQVFTAGNTVYGIKTDGTLWVWGDLSDNKSGLVDNELEYSSTPKQITAITGKVQFISGCGYNRVIGVGEDGVATKLYSWGSNADGALGNGTGVDANMVGSIEYTSTPGEVSLEEGINVKQISSGIQYSVVLSEDGTIYGWGKNRGGQLGNLCETERMTFEAKPIVCTVMTLDEEGAYAFGPDDIPANLSTAKKLVLLGTWNTSKLGKLAQAIGNTSGFPPAGNATIEEIDMSRASIESGTTSYAQIGFSSKGVFFGLKALTKFTMPAAAEAANFSGLREMFWNCAKLEAIDVTGCENVTNMESAFYGCAALKTIDLSNCDKITNSLSMLDNCTSLETVKLPAHFVPGKYTFAYCESLKTIDWSLLTGETVPTFAEYLFDYVDNLSAITLIVPDAMVDAFKAHANWSKLNIVGASTTSIDKVNTGEVKTNSIYNLNGQFMGNDKGALKHGIYIINGKKVLVK